MSTEQYDVVVIGSGPSGGIVARQCRKAGLDVAVVERNGWGGVCPLRGCEPKKTLADAAHALLRFKEMSGHGPEGTVRMDWPQLMQFKRSLIDPIPDAVEKSLHKSGIATISGEATLTPDGTVSVDGYGTIKAEHIVLAVGAGPRSLEIDGADLLLRSDQFLEMDSMPQSIIFLGGGFISFEFACIAAAAGAQVSIIHRNDRVLKGFDPDLVDTLVQAMEAAGIQIHLNQDIARVESTDSGTSVHTRHAHSGEAAAFEADKVVVGAGRVPNITGLGLEAWEIAATPAGITVNSRMQSPSNPRVYAVGDCAEAGLPLTMTAALQAEVAARNILGKTDAISDLTGTASVVFTHPSLAAVGMHEEEAVQQNLEYVVHAGNAAKWSEHKRIGLGHAAYKIIEDTQSGKILGAHYLGQHAEEVINIFGMAIRHGLTKQDLLEQPWAYPSFGYALRYMLS